MKIRFRLIFLCCGITLSGSNLIAATPVADTGLVVKTRSGLVEGTYESGLRVFKGIPFAAPPVGQLRWREPQPVQPWSGIRKALAFGPRAMQPPIFGDMMFRSNGMSEDCLYLNVWSPAAKPDEKLPVLVYFYGGGLVAGDGSEFRYDGAAMARRGIVTLTVNYRLGVFGFLCLPELTKTSPLHASGNYGLLDQAAALRWVKDNISAFGGDPGRVTIAGESAGSISVSAQMASPVSRNLFAGAIGESGAVMGSLEAMPLAAREEQGKQFMTSVKAKDLAALRQMDANAVMEAARAHQWEWFGIAVDGYFLPEPADKIFASGKQANVPLLAGWNSEESGSAAVLGNAAPTRANFEKAVGRLYGNLAGKVMEVYAPPTDSGVAEAARDLAGDRFISFGTWKWIDMHASYSIQPVYRYRYDRPRPATRDGKEPAGKGASHSAEIEYALGNLPSNRVFDWQPEDYTVSLILQEYFANFVKTGNPNGIALPLWKPVVARQPAPVMIIDVRTRLETETTRNRYLLLNQIHGR
ncbi:carboxylesterase/lipase family protein [Flavihumibacter petaseus]|nr:carboxylesterase family protein [Flavihumibacter petaseus]